MTDEQINVAIAQECGWKHPLHPDAMAQKQGWSMPEVWWLDSKGKMQIKSSIPNYCGCLNAMHEAEKVLTDDQREVFYPRNLGAWQSPFNVIYATARQRAEAFLRTVGKWATDKDSLTVQPTTEDSSVVGKEVQQ